MAYDPRVTAGNLSDPTDTGANFSVGGKMGSRKLFKPLNPGSPGKLGRSTTKAESLSKLRGKGALA